MNLRISARELVASGSGVFEANVDGGLFVEKDLGGVRAAGLEGGDAKNAVVASWLHIHQ